MIGNMQYFDITNYLFDKATMARQPIYGAFELCPYCNFNCKMCYVHQKESEVKAMGKQIFPASYWINLAKEAKEQGLLYLLLTGGEPFAYPDFKEVYSELIKMGFIISINSNGTLIDENWVEFLKENPPSRINITLYGTSDETYEKVCGIKKGYTRAKAAIERLIEAGIQVKLNSTLIPYNVADLSGMIEFAKDRNLHHEFAMYMFPPIRLDEDKVGTNVRFTPEEMAYNTLREIGLKHGEEDKIQYAKSIVEGYCPIPGMDYLCKETEGSGVLCRSGRAGFWVTWEGNLTPCGMMPVPKVSIVDKDFKSAWDILVEETAKIRLAPECKECKNQNICHSCAGICYGENLDFTKKPEYLCEYVKALKKECEKII